MNKNYNIGLSMLKMIMCYMVICCHFLDVEGNVSGGYRIIASIRDYAVPVFMMMSFYLTNNLLKNQEADRIKNRFRRLLIPQVGWTVIYWISYKGYELIEGSQCKITISDFGWQLLTGHSPNLNPTMWYQVDLIIITLLFLIIIRIFRRYYLIVLHMVALFAIYMQYSGLNLFFGRFRYEINYPFGRFLEMLPIAVLGFTIAEYGVLDILKLHWNNTFLIYALLLALMVKYPVFSNIQGWGYAGLGKIAFAFLVLCIFYIAPFERLPYRYAKGLITASQYTLGIYCMHRLVQSILSVCVTRLKLPIASNTILYCILIYLVSYIIAFIFTRLVNTRWIEMLFE